MVKSIRILTVFSVLIYLGCELQNEQYDHNLVVFARDTVGNEVPYGVAVVTDSETESVVATNDINEGIARLLVPFKEDVGYFVTVAAPNRKAIVAPLLLDRGEGTVTLEAVLPSNVKPNPDHVEISIDGFGSATMIRREDGSFVHHIETPELPLTYFLMGASEDGWPLAGSQYDDFEVEGTGYVYFKSVEIANPVRFDSGHEASVESLGIEYHPPSLSQDGHDTDPVISTTGSTMAGVLAIDLERNRSEKTLLASMKKGEGVNREEILSRHYKLVLQALHSENHTLASYAATEILDPFLDSLVTDRDRSLALDRLSFDSPYWIYVGSLWNSGSRLGAAYQEILIQLTQANPNRRVRAYATAALTRVAKELGNEHEWRKRYAELQSFSELRGMVASLQRKLDPDARIRVGKAVPSFEAPLVDSQYRGETYISSQRLLGTVYLLEFWGTWCAPCVDAIPALNDLWEEFGGEGFQIVSLASENSVETIRRFRHEKHEMPWLHVLLDGEAATIVQTFEVTSYPTTILVDRDGTIVSLEHAKSINLKASIAGLLGKGSGNHDDVSNEETGS